MSHLTLIAILTIAIVLASSSKGAFAAVWRTHMDKAFAELVMDGPVQVVGAMAGRQNANYFVKRQGGADYMRVEKKTFTETMSEYLKDDPTVVQKITANPDYSINNIELVIREYNQDQVTLCHEPS